MAESRRQPAPRSALATALSLVLVAIPGFGLGLLAGVAWREPGLLVAHLLGRSREVAWSAPAAPAGDSAPMPPVASAPPAEARPEPPPAAKPAPAEKPAPPSETEVTRIRPDVITPGAETPPAGPGTATAGHFAVQVGAFAESASAERLAKHLRSRGFESYVSPGSKQGEARWRVRVGPLPTREQAEQEAARLKSEEKLPTWVLDEDGAV